MNQHKPLALFTVYTKNGIPEFAQALTERGWDILSSGGTAKAIRSHGVETIDVSAVTGLEPVLGHKVVTLSPQISGGILVDVTNAKEMEEFMSLGWPLISLVVVDCYPLAEEIAKEDSTFASVTKQTDIGGISLISAAVKGGKDVIVDMDDCAKYLKWLDAGKPDEKNFLLQMHAKAARYVASYREHTARYLGEIAVDLPVTEYSFI